LSFKDVLDFSCATHVTMVMLSGVVDKKIRVVCNPSSAEHSSEASKSCLPIWNVAQ
jgi:hypothetical protein